MIASDGQICVCSCCTIFSKDINRHHVDHDPQMNGFMILQRFSWFEILRLQNIVHDS